MALQGTLTHRKTRRLAKRLQIDQTFALGIVEALWDATRRRAVDGGVGRMNNRDLLAEMHSDLDPELIVRALVEEGWIDPHSDPEVRLYVHDWHLHSDDTTDAKLGRATLRYANGALPRLTKLAMKERAPIWARYGTQDGDEGAPAPLLFPDPAPAGHVGALPVPEPEPVPKPEEPPYPPSQAKGGAFAQEHGRSVDDTADEQRASNTQRYARGDDALSEAVAKVLRECNLTDRRLARVVLAAIQLAAAKCDDAPNMNALAERMIAGQRSYVNAANRGLLKYTVRMRRFFAEGLWLDDGLWGWDQDKFARRMGASIGMR